MSTENPLSELPFSELSYRYQAIMPDLIDLWKRKEATQKLLDEVKAKIQKLEEEAYFYLMELKRRGYLAPDSEAK